MTKKKLKRKIRKLKKKLKWYRKRWISETLSKSMRERTNAI